MYRQKLVQAGDPELFANASGKCTKNQLRIPVLKFPRNPENNLQPPVAHNGNVSQVQYHGPVRIPGRISHFFLNGGSGGLLDSPTDVDG